MGCIIGWILSGLMARDDNIYDSTLCPVLVANVGGLYA